MNATSSPRGPVEAAFAAQLQAAMQAKRLAPPDLAAKAGISGSAVRNYLHGNFMPRPTVLAMLEKVLGVQFTMTAGVTQPTIPLAGAAQANPTATATLTTEPGLTISEAKRRLARTLGVNEAQIEISVKA